MNNPFSQPKITYKICFITNYEDIERFEEVFPEEKILGLSTYEINSSTIDSQPKDNWAFEVFVDVEPKLVDLQRELEAHAKKHNLGILSQITYEVIEDKDWITEYQEQLQPIEIGNFFITSSLRKKLCPAGKTPIYIEASRAFGTGDHSTTSLCIKAMERLKSKQIQNILDIGTGSGILSFVAGEIWQNSKILACDIEETSIEVAKLNQSFNNSSIEFYQNNASGLNIPKAWPDPFDLILANILALPLIAMKESIKSLCHKDTKVILSGFLDYQQEELVAHYEESGFKVEKVFLENKWVSLTLKVNND